MDARSLGRDTSLQEQFDQGRRDLISYTHLTIPSIKQRMSYEL